ncbi:MAG: DUF362 domain-containing protein [Kiritimatiellia bacterium]|nr:DUF362 domain-containing protein [Kiritimatiellia bacterium]
MNSVYFATVKVKSLERQMTLPAKFQRMLDRINLAQTVKGRRVCIKMHLGRALGYTTIHPLFVRILVDKVREAGAKRVFVADGDMTDCEMRGYTRESLGCAIVGLFRKDGPGVRTVPIGFRTFKNALISKEILDSEVMIVFSHVKGHGAAGFGGAGKNIAMGCIPSETRQEIHRLEGGIEWRRKKCLYCKKCLEACPNKANQFVRGGAYRIFFHHCTFCQHCIMACPAKALLLTSERFHDFQKGLALVAQRVIEHIGAERMLYLNQLMNITIVCDCWGFSMASLVPDIGILGSRDIVAIERASLDLINNKSRNINPDGLPEGRKLRPGKHLFQKIHGKDPYVMSDIMADMGLGQKKYRLEEIE